MLRFILSLCLVPVRASAQEAPQTLDLHSVCSGRLQNPAARVSEGEAVRLVDTPEGTLAFLDMGFCSAFLLSQNESVFESAAPKPAPALDALRLMATGSETIVAIPTPKPRWKVRFYASNSFTTYFNTNVAFKSSRYDITVKEYSWAERSSREFFEPQTWKKPGNNPAQILDEPSNTYVVSIERNGNEFFLSAFHPKFLQDNAQVKYMKGTIDGTHVDGYAPVDTPFTGSYAKTPGESDIVRNENTYREMSFEIGYGHRFVLLDSRFGSISYVPGIAAGVMLGGNYSAVMQEGKWWDFDGYGASYGLQGVGGSLTNRVELNSRNERVGIFYENKLSAYRLETGFLDGTEKYTLKLMGNSFGLKFMLYNPEKHQKKLVDARAMLAP